MRSGRSRTNPSTSSKSSKRSREVRIDHDQELEEESSASSSSASIELGGTIAMRLREESEIVPAPLVNKRQPGLPSNSLYNGSKFKGYQKSRGNSYDVEIALKNVQNSHICGYLTIKGLTDEFPTISTFFSGEIISRKYPFLTRKWEADEEVDKKHC